jgi:hypothetical protein
MSNAAAPERAARMAVSTSPELYQSWASTTVAADNALFKKLIWYLEAVGYAEYRDGVNTGYYDGLFRLFPYTLP